MRPLDEMTHEVAQRGAATDAQENRTASSNPAAPRTTEQTSGYGNREDRENPGMGLGAQQSGERQSHELVGEGTRVGKDEPRKVKGATAPRESPASSQNAARIADFEDRPSR
jgi:hypothetical protein